MTRPHPLRALAALAWLAAAPLCAVAFVFIAPQAASVLHAGAIAPLSVGDAIASTVHLITHEMWSDPAAAYPPAARALMPAAAGFYAAVAWMTALSAALLSAVWRQIDRTLSSVRVGRRRYSPRGARPRTWARPRDLDRLLVDRPVPGRLHVGWIGRPRRLLACEADVNLALIAPTGAGKTSCGVIPWLLEHPGPVVALSTKADVLAPTLARRQQLGRVWQWNPFDQHSAGWNPLAGCEDWTTALLTARWLTDSVETARASSDVTRYWNREASRLLAPLMHAAALTDTRAEGPRIERLLRWADDPDEAGTHARAVLSEHEAEQAHTQLQGILALDDRSRSATFQTAGSLLEAYRYPPVQQSCWNDITPERFLDGGAHTLYLIATTRDQRLLRPLVVAMISQVINAAMSHANQHGPLKHPVLFLLDETANIAPLSELPQYLSTGRGIGLRFVTVWQALAQMHDTYGEAAGAILANSQAKLILGSTTDERTRKYTSDLLGEETVIPGRPGSQHAQHAHHSTYRPLADARALQQLPDGHAILIHTNHKPAAIRLRPWYHDPHLQQLARPSVHTP
jgi:type IV secretion system protein VirD4